jgi:uncharacterized membrane protein YagU involved in acid resistance
MKQEAGLRRKIVAGIVASLAVGLSSFLLGTVTSVVPLLWIEGYTTFKVAVAFVVRFGPEIGLLAAIFGTIFAAVFGHLIVLLVRNKPRLQLEIGAVIGTSAGVLHYHFDIMRSMMEERFNYQWDTNLDLVLAVCIAFSGALSAIVFFSVRNEVIEFETKTETHTMAQT